ncbi:MAG: hypothetical protein SOI00_06970 [Rahnella inusitata]|jgi:hypothetical protein
MKNKNDRILLFVCIIFSITLALPIFLYAIHIGNGLSTKNEDWGNFGSFIGGVYGSFFSSLSLIIVIWAAVESKKSSKEQVNILKNDQHHNQFSMLVSHLKDNFSKTYLDSFKISRPIDTHYYKFRTRLSISVLTKYDENLALVENLRNYALEYYKMEHNNIFENESKLFKCILEIINRSSSDLAEAFKVIFEATFDEEQRLSLEFFTRAHYPALCESLDEWPTLSKIPSECLENAKLNIRLNEL